MKEKDPFIFGAQYYRAPTPDPECWEADLRKIKELDFNAVKYFVQWRWSHRKDNLFYFDDLDRLMKLADKHSLDVTLNLLLDMAPVWLFGKYPDARQVANNGVVVEPYAVAHRSIGGHPGPCYNHPGALEERKKFLTAVINHFKNHPALSMWDIWNEPELSGQQREPNIEKIVCYCRYCRIRFIEWLKNKYFNLEDLNKVWGRCYTCWDEAEHPRTTGTITDFVDWREFHLDTLSAEAQWRLMMVKDLDPWHTRYLHVVPNTMRCFNSVTCVDDFDISEHCQIFAASASSDPVVTIQLISAAGGKTCYNVESHINRGSLSIHQKKVGLHDLLEDFLPQIGLGIRGFMFWQYRPETLGAESPAWGLVKLDGTNRPVTDAVRLFWEKILPYKEKLMASTSPEPQIGIWKSRKNEIFHFCQDGKLDDLADGVESYCETLYWNNYPCRFISGKMLERGKLADLRLLIMPSCYYLTKLEAEQLDKWVRNGGVLLAEAHLAGYNATTGRHSIVLPGCGLSELWGIKELDSTSSYHLSLPERDDFKAVVSDDVRKALSHVAGAKYFPVKLLTGTTIWGAERYASLEGENTVREAAFDNDTCIISKKIGQGTVFYCGTNIGLGAKKESAGFCEFLDKIIATAKIKQTLNVSQKVPGNVHIDLLGTEDNPGFLIVINRSDKEQRISVNCANACKLKGLFSDTAFNLDANSELTINGNFVDLLTATKA